MCMKIPAMRDDVISTSYCSMTSSRLAEFQQVIPESEIVGAVDIIMTSCFPYKCRQNRACSVAAKSPRRIVHYTSTAECVRTRVRE